MSFVAKVTALAQAVGADIKALSAGKVDKLADHSLVSNVERVKIANVASEATKNATDADLRARSTHTGTQTASTISNFNPAVLDLIDSHARSDPPLCIDIDSSSNRGLQLFDRRYSAGTVPDGVMYALVRTVGMHQGTCHQRLSPFFGDSAYIAQYERRRFGDLPWSPWVMDIDADRLVGLMASGAWCQIDRTSAGDVYRYADGRMRIDTPWVAGYVPGKVRSELPVVFAPGFYPAVTTTIIFVDGATTSAQSWGQDNFLDTYFSATSTANLWKTSAEGRWKA